MIKLKNCPFCGGPARLYVTKCGICVMCRGRFSKGCGNQTAWYSDDNYINGMNDYQETAIEKAIEAWNRRVKDEHTD